MWPAPAAVRPAQFVGKEWYVYYQQVSKLGYRHDTLLEFIIGVPVVLLIQVQNKLH